MRSHDFPDEQLGKAIPYGAVRITWPRTLWVSVGTDHDTAAFAVESIRRWWNGAGRAAYPGARRLLITADAGGSNSYRTRAWKAGLAAFALQAGLAVTVCHFPPGTSKWNRIEHRLFSHITMNWRGRPLTSHEVIVNTIAATTTRTGLTVRAELDPGSYDTGVKVSDEQMAGLPLDRHDWHGEWNYTLRPEPPRPPGSPAPAAARPPRRDSAGGAHPALTGMPRADWTQLTSALVIPYQAHREAGLHIARGGPASRKPAGGYPAALTLPEMILATILRARFRMPQRVAAELFGVVTGTIAKAERQIRPLLDQRRHVIQPAEHTLRPSPNSPRSPQHTTSDSSRERKPRVNNLQARTAQPGHDHPGRRRGVRHPEVLLRKAAVHFRLLRNRAGPRGTAGRPRGDQVAGRFTLIPTSAFIPGREWSSLVAAVEGSLRLYRHKDGSLVTLADYLHRRTRGMIGSLLWLLRDASCQAILDGTEKLTRKSLDQIAVDMTAQAPPPRTAPKR